ncbi:AAA family ATPase [Pseudomonas sp. X10]
MDHFVVISGCSGGGKSTLLAELQRQGHAIVEEPGRRIVQAEARTGGQALPWVDMAAFLRRAIAQALDDHENASAGSGKWLFFDRGLVDAAAALQELTGEPLLATLGQRHRYHRRVFLAPPWPEIYEQDPERRHDMGAALAEYERLQKAYPALGYEVSLLPKVSVPERVDFVLNTLAVKSPS